MEMLVVFFVLAMIFGMLIVISSQLSAMHRLMVEAHNEVCTQRTDETKGTEVS